jgi:16S rRNA (guanine966-N2)-methyltransferase
VTRVVAGRLGGRRLAVPRGGATRPTSDRVREALFSTLGDRVAGASVLDLYAGTGALGIEALSRGAASATFVERDRRVAAVLRRNLADLGLDAEVHLAPVSRWVDALAPGRGFDLVLCDPPYAAGVDEVAGLLRRLAAGGHVAAGGTLVVERARHGPALVVPGGDPVVTDARRYGDTVLYYLRRPTDDEGRDLGASGAAERG